MADGGKITVRDDYAVGSTLDVSGSPCPSPFTDDTLKAFIQAFDKENQSAPDDQGTFHLFATLCQDQKSKLKALGVDGKLDFSYGPVSGDANVKFAMDNVQGSLDLTMVVRATQNGRDVKNGLDKVLDLKLRDFVTDAIKGGMTFDQFKQQYGEYLIIGFEYGGQVLFESTYSTKSSEDKMSVAGGLSLSFGKMGFNISGSVNGNYKSEDVSKSTNITTEYSIFPSFNDPLINGKDGIIPLLEKISNPTQNGLNIDNGDEKEFGTLAEEVNSKIQTLLSGHKLDKINCIVLEIDIVSSVHEEFAKQAQNANNVKPFFRFANPLYMTLTSILKALEVVNTNYNQLDAKNKPTTTINKWIKSLNKKSSLMFSIDGAKLYEYAKLYVDALEEDEKEDDSAQIDKLFYKMDADILENEFNDVIMKPYDEMLKTPKKTDTVSTDSDWIGKHSGNDTNLLPKSSEPSLIKGIRIYRSNSLALDNVGGISVQFENDDSWYMAGSDAMGIQGTYICKDGEYFNKVSSRSGEAMDYLEFSTNNNNKVSGGGSGGGSNPDVSGGKLCGLTVRTFRGFIAAIKCKWVPL